MESVQELVDAGQGVGVPDSLLVQSPIVDAQTQTTVFFF